MAAPDYMLGGARKGGPWVKGWDGESVCELGDLPAWTLPLPTHGQKGPEETRI